MFILKTDDRLTNSGETGTMNVNANIGWEKAGWIFLLIFAASDMVSISVAQISVVGMTACWVGRWVCSKTQPEFSPLFWPMVAFAITSILAALFSLDPSESIKDSKDLVHIFIFFAAYDLFTQDSTRVGFASRIVVAMGAVTAIVGLSQAITNGIDLTHRISGFNDIYMTYAGLLMLASILGFAVTLFSFKKWNDAWIPIAIALMAVAVLLSLTRNAWIGLFAGCVVLLAMRKAWLLAVIPVVMAVAIALSPINVKERVYSIFDFGNSTNKERILLWGSGLKIVADNPVTGVGQNSFPLVYPQYRSPDVTEPQISHLHNNFLQIAAERGLLGLAAWLSIWITALWVMISAWIRSKDTSANHKTGLALGIAGVVAFLSAGMFEYNFGDSEIQMLYHLVLSMGMAAAYHCKDDTPVEQ